MAEPRRMVPYSVRTLADEVGANRSTIGYLLAGERQTVDETVARGVAEAFGCSVEDLFEPAVITCGNGNTESGEAQ